MRKVRSRPGVTEKGRTSCTPEVIDAFADFYSRGHAIERAAILADISETTVRNWWNRGETGEEPFATFVRKSMRARMLAADDAAKRAHAEHVPWWLERVQHEDFGRKDRIDVTSGGIGIIEAVRQARRLAGKDDDDPRDVIILPPRKGANGTAKGSGSDDGGNGESK